MPEFEPIPLMTSEADSAIAWYNRSLAQILGLDPGLAELREERLSQLHDDREQRALAELIDKRFKRRIDDATGVVTIETVGEAMTVLAQDDETVDPLLYEVSRNYMETARTAILSIETDICVPGVCTDEVVELVWQTRLVLERLAVEAPRRGSLWLVFTYIHELLNEDYGTIVRLEKIFECETVRQLRTVEIERAITSIRTARRAIVCLEEVLCEFAEEECEQSVTTTLSIVRRCASHISIHIRDVRQVLRHAGIGDCELEGYDINLGNDLVVLGGTTFESINVDVLLRGAEAEAQRWVGMVDRGRGEQIDSIRGSAVALRPAIRRLDGAALAKYFALSGHTGERVAARVARMTSYVGSVLDAIIDDNCDATDGGDAKPGKGKRGKRHKARPPKDDAADMA